MNPKLYGFIFIYVSFVLEIQSASLEIKPCENNDGKCVKESTQAILPKLLDGVPELGIDKTDPLFLKRVDLSTGSLKLILKNINVEGIKNCQVNKMERVGLKIKGKGICDATVDGQYEMSGHLLILPVQGKGRTHLVLRKVLLNVEADLQEIEQNGKKYWDVKSWTHTYDVKEKSDLIFENMFNGNEILAQASAELFETGWKEIVTELGPPLMKAILQHVVNNANLLFHAIPINELTLS